MRTLVAVALAGCGFHGAALTIDGAPGGEPTHDDAHVVDGNTQDAPVDASNPSADAPACPTGSGWQTFNNSHYYYSQTGDDRSWWSAEDHCEGMTLSHGAAVHLAVIQNVAEAMAIGAHTTIPYSWIGMFQPTGQASASTGWLWIVGGNGLTGDWELNEPSDKNPGENSEENFAEIYPNGTLNDVHGTDNLHYICECDGVPVSSSAQSQVPDEPE